MISENNHTLKDRRQYILAPEKIQCAFVHRKFFVNSTYTLYAHIDLPVTEVIEQGKKILLLGDLFDYMNPDDDNHSILMGIISLEFEDFINKLADYTGRFVIIQIEGERIRLMHDATAARKIFYCKKGSKLWFSSRPTILGSILKLKCTKEKTKLDYYCSKDFLRLNNSNVGDTTLYDDVFQLMPNHYFDVDAFKLIRYWPNTTQTPITVKEAADKCAQIIKGYMQSITTRYTCMLPLTAGKDSRMLLAATRNFHEKVYYYINNNPQLNDRSADIRIPKKLCSKLGLEFHIEKPVKTVGEDFKKIYFENCSMASKDFLPIIYNYYFNHDEKVNLPGNIASAAYEMYRYFYRLSDGISFAALNEMEKYEFAVAYYTRWYNECKDLCKEYNIDPLTLFYWEERICNWGCQMQMEKDIAQEEINPFNSRLLITLFLASGERNIKPPFYLLQHQIMRNLWPEVLSVPINPGYKNVIKKILAAMGLLFVTYKIIKPYCYLVRKIKKDETRIYKDSSEIILLKQTTN